MDLIKNKKIVSSVFEPKREVSISYLNPKTTNIDYTTLTVGNFDILSGATEFVTINSNAKSRVSGSLKYQYSLGGSPATGSRSQLETTVQMVTSSQTVINPDSSGILSGVIPSQGTTPTMTGTSQVELTNVPITSNTGTGATIKIVFSVLGAYVSSTVEVGGSGYP